MLWPLHDKLCVRCGDFALIRHMFLVRATDKLADGSVSLGYPSWHRFWERLTCFACGLLRSTPSAPQLDGYPYRLRPRLVSHICRLLRREIAGYGQPDGHQVRPPSQAGRLLGCVTPAGWCRPDRRPRRGPPPGLLRGWLHVLCAHHDLHRLASGCAGEWPRFFLAHRCLADIVCFIPSHIVVAGSNVLFQVLVYVSLILCA